MPLELKNAVQAARVAAQFRECQSSRAGLGNLRGGFLVEVIGCSLGMGSGGKNGAVVVLQNLQPCRDIGGVLLPRFLLQFEVGAQESRAQLGNEFLAAVTFIAPALAAEVAVEALRVLRPVRLMPTSA